LLSAAQDRQFERVFDAGHLELVEACRIKEIFQPGRAAGNLQPAALSGGARQRIPGALTRRRCTEFLLPGKAALRFSRPKD